MNIRVITITGVSLIVALSIFSFVQQGKARKAQQLAEDLRLELRNLSASHDELQSRSAACAQQVQRIQQKHDSLLSLRKGKK